MAKKSTKPPIRLKTYAGILGRDNESVPGWRRARCRQCKPIEDFGFRYKADERILRIQSWCNVFRAKPR
jgi:hypothetical protein